MFSRSLLPSIFAFAIFSAFTSSSAHAALQLPSNLTNADREQALRIVGLGTSSKLLSDPYPLGGYSGFEAGLSVESLPTDDLSRLGSGLSSPQQNVVYPKLTFGKGIYNNVDLFLLFTPFRRQDNIALYGAMLRWGFYQDRYLPLSASLVIHANNANLGNVLTSQTYGADVMGGMSLKQVSLFAGLGWVQSLGTFSNSVTGVGNIGESVTGLHTVVGASLRVYDEAFLAFQLDRTEVPVISGKLGFRF